jgi:hypothetical protein
MCVLKSSHFSRLRSPARLSCHPAHSWNVAYNELQLGLLRDRGKSGNSMSLGCSNRCYLLKGNVVIVVTFIVAVDVDECIFNFGFMLRDVAEASR